MKFEKLLYIMISAILVAIFILISFVFPPFQPEKMGTNNPEKIYFVDHISSAHQKVIDKFNEKYKGQIEVESINLSFEKFSTNERKELLARYLRSKSDRIDIFSVDQIWVPRFTKWAVPLDKLINEEQKKNLLKYAIESCIYRDSLVAVPLYIDIALMYYRKDLLSRLPDYEKIKDKLHRSITWEELISLGKKYKGRTNNIFTFQANDYEGLICIFAEMMASLGKPMIINDSLQIQTEEGKKALQTLVDLVHKYQISPKEVTLFKENESYRYFIENNGMFLRGWPSFLGKDTKLTQNRQQFVSKIEKVPTPHFAGYKTGSVYGGWNLMISRYSKNIPEVMKFVNFILSEESQKIMFEEGGYLPVINSIYEDSAYVGIHPDLGFYKGLLDRGFHRPFTEQYTNISDVLSYHLNRAIKREVGIDEALRLTAEKLRSASVLIK